MDAGAKLLEPLLMRHAEMLLLVHHHQAKILDHDTLGQERVGADHDVDLALGQVPLGLGRLLGGHQARKLGHPHRQASETLGKGGVVLAGQQRGRHHHRHLLAAHRRDEGGAQGDLGLAESHIAADQPVHGTARGQVGQHVLHGAQLVVGLGIGESGAEFVEGALGRGESLAGFELARGGHGDQLLGHVADALLQARLAPLPGHAAQLVELRAGRLPSHSATGCRCSRPARTACRCRHR